MADCRYYLGPWVAVDEGSERVWTPPAGTAGLVDLGNNDQVAQATGTVRSVGFFAVPADQPVLAADWALLGRGDLRELAFDAAQRSAWLSIVGTAPPVGGTLLGALWAHLTDLADETGDDTCRPLVPTVGRMLELHLGGHSVVRREAFDLATHPHAPKLIAALKLHLRDERLAALAGRRGRSRKEGPGPPQFVADMQFHRRLLKALLEKYRVADADWEVLRPTGWPQGERPLPHDTTITENFNCTDADLDAASTQLDWTELGGDLDVSSNTLVTSSGTGTTGYGRAESDLSSSDNYSQCGYYISSGSANLNPRVGTRYSSSANTCYMGQARPSSSYFRHQKVIAGTHTDLATGGTPAAGTYTLKITADGSSITLYNDGVAVVGPTTDTAISTGLRAGVAITRYTTTVYMDNFEAGDLAAAAGKPWYAYAQQ